MEFSPAPATIMHVDINSCFATVEQQANPGLRGKPLVVAAYVENHGCILAASTEAKWLGIKTGMRVWEAKNIYRHLAVLAPDPEKYRAVNKQLFTILSSYTPDISVESIDEMVFKMPNPPAGEAGAKCQMLNTAKEIKQRIKQEIGEWMTVSIGIAPNRYLAKVASGLHKPDGLDVICKRNIQEVFSRMKLEDMCGIKEGNATRLRTSGISSPLAMLGTSAKELQVAFRSIVGYHWWMRLHGYEDGSMYKTFGSPEGTQKSFGQSHALGKPHAPNDPKLWQVLAQLVMKMGRRLRSDHFTATGVSVSLLFVDHTHWGLQQKTKTSLFTDADFYSRARLLLAQAPTRPVRILAVSCFDLAQNLYAQQSLFMEENRKEAVTRAVDAMQNRFGPFVVSTGRMLALEQKVLDRIAFGKV